MSRPGALAWLAEPGWATPAIAADDLEASAAFTQHTVGSVVRDARTGRRLARLGAAAGFEVAQLRAVPAVSTRSSRRTPSWG